MKTLSLTASLLALLSGAAGAETIGVSIVNFDNNFQSLLRQGIEARAGEVGVDVQIEDAQNDSARQLDQINNFLASGVDAIIVQDLGLAHIVRQFFPGLRLHASTQMAVHNLAGVKQAAAWGFRRIVLARELTALEIKKMAEQLQANRVRDISACFSCNLNNV